MDTTVLATALNGIETDITALLPTLLGFMAFFIGVAITLRLIKRFSRV